MPDRRERASSRFSPRVEARRIDPGREDDRRRGRRRSARAPLPARPRASRSIRTVVSAGLASRALGMSSNPATASRSGTAIPRSRNAVIAPIAITSLTAKTASTPSSPVASSRAAAAYPPSRVNSPCARKRQAGARRRPGRCGTRRPVRVRPPDPADRRARRSRNDRMRRAVSARARAPAASSTLRARERQLVLADEHDAAARRLETGELGLELVPSRLVDPAASDEHHQSRTESTQARGAARARGRGRGRSPTSRR